MDGIEDGHKGPAGSIPAGLSPDVKQLRALAEYLPAPCWLAHADGFIHWYNPQWHHYCGSTPEQMEGWGWQSVHHPDHIDRVTQQWTASIATGAPFEMVFPLRGADGLYRPFLTRARPIHDAQGAVAGWVGLNTDISAQAAVEEQLNDAVRRNIRETAERDAVLSQLTEAVIITRSDGAIRFVNDAARRLHGVDRLDARPDEYSATYGLLTEDGQPHPTDTLPLTRAVVDDETVLDARWRIRRPDGSEILALGNAKPVLDSDGHKIGAVLTIRDDTARHGAETALAEALRVKDMLLIECNHRIKNSLQLVSALLSLQATKSTSAEVKHSLGEAINRIGIIGRMHQQLYMTSQHDDIDLCAYLHEIALQNIASADSGMDLDFGFSAPGAVRASVDVAVPLGLMTNELLTNAVKYAFRAEGDRPAHGHIALAIDTDDSDLHIRISDDGCGLPDGFDLTRSTGFGMRIVSTLVRQVGGRIAVMRQAPGSTFVISVPRAALVRHRDAQAG